MADAEGQEGGEESADGVASEPYAGAGRDLVAGVPATLLVRSDLNARNS